MANNRSLLIVSILLAILSLVGSFVINIASSNLPGSWKPYIWLAYPIAGIIVVLTIVFVYWQWRVTVQQDKQSKPIQSIDSQKADAIYNAPGGTINVNKESDKGALHHEQDIIVPKLELKLIDNMKQHVDQLAFSQIANNQDFYFGIAMINNAEGSLPAEKLDITIECNWDGSETKNAPKFKTDSNNRTTPDWIASRDLIQQGEIPHPATLSFHGTIDDRCAYGHNLEWYRFSVVLFERMSGRFILNYRISSAYPRLVNDQGILFILIDSGKFGTKSITLNDILTGEELHIEFNLDTDQTKINGVQVKRARVLESHENQIIFIPTGTSLSKMYHLSRQQIEWMKSL
jgi:hypothetical protein